MTSTERDFLKNLKVTIWGAAGVLSLTMLTAGVGFYYKAGKDIEYIKLENENRKIEIKDVRVDVILKTDQKVNKDIFEITLQNINFQLSELNKKIDNKIK
jgi:hypothetical protein